MALKGKKILITGASSGIGRALAKKLVEEGDKVWGIARRKNLLSDLKNELFYPENYYYSVIDITKKYSWEKIIRSLKNKKFIPDVVIFNAAIFENDLKNGINISETREMIETNYLSVIEGIKKLLPLLDKGSQVVAISSSSALKGSGEEGIGYASSKAALSIAFENLHLKYRNEIYFKTLFFGPIKTGMNPFSRQFPLSLSEDDAANKVISAIDGNKAQYYFPWSIFFAIKVAKLLPSPIYFHLLEIIDQRFHKKMAKVSQS